MNKRSFLMALLCLFLVFQAVSADPMVLTDLVYNGSAQELVSDPANEGGAYSADGGRTWGEAGALPEMTGAGSLEIFWKAGEDDPGHSIGTAVIAPKELELTWPDENGRTYTYNGEEQYPEPSVEGIIAGDDCAVVIEGKQADAGNYTAAAVITGNTGSNYKLPENSSCPFTVNPKEVVVYWDDTSLVYNGMQQAPGVRVTECLEKDSGICENAAVSGGQTDAGTGYRASVSIDSSNYLIIESDRTIDFGIAPLQADIEWGETTLTYSGDQQAPSAIIANAADDAVLTVEGGETDAGTGYTASVTGVSSGNYTLPEDDSVRTEFAIEPKALNASMITFEPKRAFYSDGAPHSVTISISFNGKTLEEGTDYIVDQRSVLAGTEPGTYMVTVTAVGDGAKDAFEGNFSGSASASWAILDPDAFELYEIGEIDNGMQTFCNGECDMPATGFSPNSSVYDAGSGYVDLKMRLQIPVINIDTELTGVRGGNGSWQVSGLGERAGLLSGSFVPGQGFAVIAGHNTLSETEAGPFMQLITLEANDVIFINTPEGDLLRFRVYANELFGAGEMAELASFAEKEPGSIALVTCENESAEGGFLNRRVVFAKPLY